MQYRYEGNTTWSPIHTWVTNPKDSLNTSYSLLGDKGSVNLSYDMSSDNFFPQGAYYFRAFTTTPYGDNPNDAATVYSSEVTVIKDNVRPRNLTTPTPANGILGYGDDLSIEFNEDIVPGYVSDKNVIVTAKLNDQPVNHEVAKQLRPYGDEQVTVNPIFLNGDFSVDCWMRWEDHGSILRLGEEQFTLSVDQEGHIVATMGGAQVTSRDVVPKNVWTYIVLSYKSSEKMFSALAQYDKTTLELFTNQKVDEGVVQMVHYSDDNYLYLGNMNGAMHDLSLFNIYRDVHEAAANRNQTNDNYVYGLVNYWPMNEGHGYKATDTRHTHDFIVNDSWLIDNVNYSLMLDGETPAEVDISSINTSQGDSYAVEMWVYPGTTLNVTVDQVHDLNGNTSLPIRWTAYVQRNTLKWTKDSVNVIKKYGDDYSFDVIIENKGGSTEYYTLYNMPQWLSLIDSERTDDVAPLSTKILRFKVDPLVAIGNYDVAIGLQGNNEILEPLRIVMMVNGEMPNWDVDPSQYENAMSIVGQIYMNGVLMSMTMANASPYLFFARL